MQTILKLFILTLVLTSCASQERKKEVKNKAAMSTVTDAQALEKSIQHAIDSSENLSPAQKQKLEDIIASNKKLAMDLTQESFKFRSVLIEELLEEKVDRKKIKTIKKEIRKIEEKKLANTFETIERILEVVSKTPDKYRFTQPLHYFDRGGSP